MTLKVIETTARWTVIDAGTGQVKASSFATMAEAWAWVDRNESYPIDEKIRRIGYSYGQT